jgi:hypothetical protein
VRELAMVACLYGVGGAANADPASPVALSFGWPSTTAIDPRPLLAKLNRASRALLACYDPTQLAVDEETLTLTIGASGKVTEASVEGVSGEIEKCLVAALTRIKVAHPKSGKPVEVTVPMTYDTGPQGHVYGASPDGGTDVILDRRR